MIHIPLGNLIWKSSKEFHSNHMHPFKGSLSFLIWTVYIRFGDLIVFDLDNVHPFKESCRLFLVWTMYIHLRNLIVFFSLDDIHPFKESYRLSFFVWMMYIHLKNLSIFFSLDDVHPFEESYRLF